VKGCHVRETSNTCSSQPTPEAYTRVYPIPRSVAIWPLYLRIDYLVVVANQYVAPRTKIGKFDESTSDIRASTALRRQQSWREQDWLSSGFSTMATTRCQIPSVVSGDDMSEWSSQSW